MKVVNRIHKSLCFAVAACGVALAGPAQAADVSAWSEDSRSAVRLIAGSNEPGAAQLRAGIEIKMQPGWHTYWRYPGDSGVPPNFDFSGSDNLKKAKVLYPAPRLLSDESGHSVGYEGGVIFPVEVTPKQPDKPVRLRLKLDYAVCEKLCMPVATRAELTIGIGASTQDAALKTAEARVPKPASAADIGLTVRRVNDAPKPLIAVDLKAWSDKDVALLVEGPTPEWALPIPAPMQGAPAGHRKFGFELDGFPVGADPKGPLELTFTVVEGDRALEVKTRLD